MNHRTGLLYCLSTDTVMNRRWFSVFLFLLLAYTTTLANDRTERSNSTSNLRATHILGFAGARNNSKGVLSIEGDSLEFRRKGKPTEKVNINSIRDVVLGNESKQVGGIPMTLAKSAIPYSGGRVVSLFSHKKYGTLTLEYQDDDGGFHGAVFELKKGQAEGFRNELLTKRASFSNSGNQPAKHTEEASSENQ
jgi:hypothetical protein